MNKTYGISDGTSDLTTGLQGHDHARKVAQRLADERGSSVVLYEMAGHSEEGGDEWEVKPTPTGR